MLACGITQVIETVVTNSEWSIVSSFDSCSEILEFLHPWIPLRVLGGMSFNFIATIP